MGRVIPGATNVLCDPTLNTTRAGAHGVQRRVFIVESVRDIRRRR